MLQTRRRCCCTTQTSDGHEAWWCKMGRTTTSPASHEVGQNLHLYCPHSTCPCTHAHTHTHARIQMHAQGYTHTFVNTHTYMHTCTHTHTHTHTHTCLWTHTHAHTFSFRAKRCTHYCTAYTLSTYSCPCEHTHTHTMHISKACAHLHTLDHSNTDWETFFMRRNVLQPMRSWETLWSADLTTVLIQSLMTRCLLSPRKTRTTSSLCSDQSLKQMPGEI